MCIEMPRDLKPMRLPSNTLNSLTSNIMFMERVKDTLDKNENHENQNLIPFKPMLDLLENSLEPSKAFNSACKNYKKSSQYTFIKKKGCIPKCNVDIIFSQDMKSQVRTGIFAISGK